MGSSSGDVAPDFLRRKAAGEAAEREAGDLADRSRLERVSDPSVRFDLTWNDIEMEQPIGFGGFSQVFRVKLLHGGDSKGDEAYALKCLNPQTKLHTKSFKTGAVDLAIEGMILSRLNHENVIKLHGIIGLNPLESFMDSDRGYFIVLDLLSDTLASKLDKYRAYYKSGSTPGSSRSSASSLSKHMTSSAVLERVSAVAIGVAKGMEYLHSQGVALRDLKPDNVGFDEKGTVKIFDLGFAREEHTIKPTEVAGSLRYMAPEVARGYGSLLISDVYSFGVLLWEICTLDKPYKHINSRDEFMDSVVLEEWRHTTSKIPSNTLRKLIKLCWQTDPSVRPSFSQVVKKLRVEVAMTKAQATSSAPVPNKGFGSSINLKRTATWTAKKLTNGISQSNLGVLRMGFRSRDSMSSQDSSNQLRSSTPSESPSGRDRVSRKGSRSKSPKNLMGGSNHGKPRNANATFGGTKLSGRRLLSKNSLLGVAEEHAEAGGDTRVSSNSSEAPIKSSLRRGMPSAPVIGNH